MSSLVYTLLFADDQVVIAKDNEDACYMTRKLKEECQDCRLEINIENIWNNLICLSKYLKFFIRKTVTLKHLE